MGRKKQNPTFIKSVRLNEDMKDFWEKTPNMNQFVIQLLSETEEWKKFIAKKKMEDNQPRLFDI